jgi:hypothetical protein
MILTFKYYINGEEVRMTAATERKLRDEYPVIAIDCLNDIIYEAKRLRKEIHELTYS